MADITGIETHEGWRYLSGIVDTYSRRAIGYSMGTRRDGTLVETALEMALFSPRHQANLVHHSDRGSHYTSWGYRAMLGGYGIALSMSGKGDPYDIALMVSFFATLQAECVECHAFQTSEQARACIFEYLEIFYDRQRLHSSLGYRSPMDVSSCQPLPDPSTYENGPMPLVGRRGRRLPAPSPNVRLKKERR